LDLGEKLMVERKPKLSQESKPGPVPGPIFLAETIAPISSFLFTVDGKDSGVIVQDNRSELVSLLLGKPSDIVAKQVLGEALPEVPQSFQVVLFEKPSDRHPGRQSPYP